VRKAQRAAARRGCSLRIMFAESMDDVYAKLEQAALYIERNPALVKSITSFPYIARSI